MGPTTKRIPAKVRAFINDMQSASKPGIGIREIEPVYDKYYHHQRRVVDMAAEIAKRLNGNSDGEKLNIAIRIYTENIVRRIHAHLPPPPEIWHADLLAKDEHRKN